MFSGLPFKYMFLSVMLFGTVFSVSSSHWLGVWAGLEINLIGFLPILVYQKSSLESESAVKYFTIQALGSSFLMFGSLFSYSLSLSWESLNSLSLTTSGGALLFLGLLLKSGIFPFHFWFPGVMSGLSWFSCLMLTTWQKLAPILLMGSLLESKSLYILVAVLCLFAGCSSLVSGLGGLNQTQVRALLAYSSIGHMGWVLYSLCSSESSTKLYFMIYVTISLCIFLSLWALELNNFKNLSSMSTMVWGGTMSFTFILLSLGGLPPLLGFISKWAVMSSSASVSLYGYILLLILGSLMSLFYYLSLFFSSALNVKSSFSWLNSDGASNLSVNVILLLNLLGGLFLFSSPIQSFM